MNLSNFYYYFTGAVSKDICKKIIKKYSSKKLSKGTVGNKTKGIRESDVCFTSDQEIYELIHPFIHQANCDAKWNFEWDYTEAVQFTKYGLHEHYNWHQDSTSEPYPLDYGNRGHHGKIRKLSTVISLTDGSKFSGGDFQVDLRNKPVSLKNENDDIRNIITLEQLRVIGTVVIFPSFLWHRVTPVTKGTRYSLVSWSLGKPWK
jgi:PKHD-type hydroxylase